jgi:hypothetical protein
MNINTKEEREYEILKIIENNEKIGPSQIHKITRIPKKTLYKDLVRLIQDETITKIKDETKSNNKVHYIVNFPEHVKKQIKSNSKEIQSYHNTQPKNKIQKSNSYPHFLEKLSLQYYQNIVSYLFDTVSIYKFGIADLEGILKNEKVKLDKEFKGKSRHRLRRACQEIQSESYSRISNSIHLSESRTSHRTEDEIRMDGMEFRKLEIIQPNEKKIQSKSDVTEYRINHITNSEDSKKWTKLAEEYNQMSDRLIVIKEEMMEISGKYSDEHIPATAWNDEWNVFHIS